jgi:alpha-maltose-1-phosphate synthase
MTGSGVLVTELGNAGTRAGDEHRLIFAGYEKDSWTPTLKPAYEIVTCSYGPDRGELGFPVPGMSDAMPYPSIRYRDLAPEQVREFVDTFRRYLVRAVEKFQPHIIHIHHLWVLTSLATAFTDIKCCVTVHGTDLKQIAVANEHQQWVLSGLTAVDHIFCVSRDMAVDARRDYRIMPARLSVLGNGFNSRVFGIDGPRIHSRRKIVLCVGKFVWWKGFVYAIRASALLCEPHQLVILGEGPVAERRALQDEAARLGVSVSLPGHVHQSEVAQWMRAADVFVLPSVHEPFGLALLEALACGCRAVAADSGGPRDLISMQLRSEGLASAVPPLSGNIEEDEDRYVRDMAAAIRLQLRQENDDVTRRAIAATVAGMTWDDVYQRMRDTYIRMLE